MFTEGYVETPNIEIPVKYCSICVGFRICGFLDCFATLAMTLIALWRDKQVVRSVFLSLTILLFFVNTAYPQVVPYITDIVGEEDMEKSDAAKGRLKRGCV